MTVPGLGTGLHGERGSGGGCVVDLGEQGVSFGDEAEGSLALGVVGVVFGIVLEPVSVSEDLLEFSFDAG